MPQTQPMTNFLISYLLSVINHNPIQYNINTTYMSRNSSILAIEHKEGTIVIIFGGTKPIRFNHNT